MEVLLQTTVNHAHPGLFITETVVFYAMQGIITQKAEAIRMTTVRNVHSDNTQTKVQLRVPRALSEHLTMGVGAIFHIAPHVPGVK